MTRPTSLRAAGKPRIGYNKGAGVSIPKLTRETWDRDMRITELEKLLRDALEIPELDESTQELNGYALDWLKRTRKALGFTAKKVCPVCEDAACEIKSEECGK